MSSLPSDSPRTGGAAAELLARAAPPQPAAHDELLRADGGLRAPWARFAAWLPATRLPDELDARQRSLAEAIRADGVTHNVYGDGGGDAAREWSLELLPLLLTPADWAAIERGIGQRARLLDALLADVYGAQRVLHEALLPPALLLRHPGYLRALRGCVPRGGLHLHVAAFDLARAPDGGWVVVAQRTQSPSGLGYVLHNRLLVSRQFPDAFRELRVQHIASSYRRLLDTVEAQAAEVAGGATPRVALLTPGPYNETYFEHAYLARYLGVPLVEGGDLTVRGERVYLKTVEGLAPVHALLRRLDDDFCDPLELRPDSTLGVPGLLQAVRAGGVVVANALGSAFLESPALEGFLPAIAQRLMGEDLLLPGLPTWWCGEAAAWRDVREATAGKLWHAAFPAPGGAEPPAPAAAEVEADPDAWVLQEPLRFSRAPLWQGGRLAARPALLRVYAIADGRQRWHVLPGGLTRVAAGEPGVGPPRARQRPLGGAGPEDRWGRPAISMQHGGTSLDTWVMTEGPVDTFSMLPQRLTVADLRARRVPVASRTAENLYWLGRYTERCEHLVRLARATLNLIDADADAAPPVLEALAELAARLGLVPWGVPAPGRAPQHFERAVLAGLADAERATSIAFNLQALARAAGALRERLSPEHWGLIRAMRQDFLPHQGGLFVPTPAEAMAALDRLGVQLAAVTGAQSDRMTRDHGWRLLTVGRFVERLVAAGGQLEALLQGAALGSGAGVDLLLELFDSTITFRARFQRHTDLIALADLLVLDDANPRAFACVLRRLRTELRKLPGGAHEALLEHLPHEGAGLTLDDLAELDEAGLRTRLLALAQRLRTAGTRLSDEIGARFFAHADGGVHAV